MKTKVQAGGFSVKLTNGELLQDGFHLVSATVVRQDSAGNRSQGEATQHYRIDLSVPELTIHLEPITPISPEADNVPLRGEIDYPYDVDPASVQVTVSYQGQTVLVQVEGKQWTSSLPLVDKQADQTVRIQIEVKDFAGNAGQSATESTEPENTEQKNAEAENAVSKFPERLIILMMTPILKTAW